uniref:IQCH-like ATP-grasp domain-containing protein n=1 Tax=Chromera velia CCMP2878 TaxID=1169474 RepID=A0A0G4HF65_9ALVE|eukprot:Cvel_6588.t1-p1 / transcript=Cvel_6588.t1 / gene=Cvel_6588 / organism=Chromera_velia_CCMP2878 / gene_product=IQ domain-containing protein H, putative / transcript_product=IQ domain-containing protein H, putative / location=Cvel_scaffold325:33968-39500(+) / protein_length=806 / sequence_SO=supercontig / SO=protein_coding / is_pseudo=false
MGHRRVEVHICSHCPSEETRKRTPEWHLRQHTQAARMFRAAMARTDVVFVAPRELASELKEYFQKVMVYRGVPQPEGRLQFVVPELVDRCPLGGLDLSTSLMTLLLCSPRALKRIRKLTQGRFSFVVPATPSPRDVEVCALTGLPLFGCDPAKAATFTGKSGIRKLVQAARLPSPVFIPFITDKEEFFVSLATLVLGHPAVSVWVFKIEDEREARGTAFLNVGWVQAAGVTRFDRQFTLAPQTAAPLGPLADAARQLGTSMAARGFFGFASVDFAAFEQRVPITPDGVAKMSASSEDLKQHALPDRPPHVPSQQPSPSPSNSNQDGSTDPNMHTETVTGTYTGSGDPGCRTSTSGTASGSALDGKILTSQVGVPREPNLGSGGRGGGKRGLMFGALRSPSPEFPTPASSSPVPPPGDQSLAALSMHLEGKPPSFVPLTLSGVSGSGSGGTVPRGITLSAHGTHQGTSETNDRRSEPLHNGPPPSTTVAQTGTGSASGVTQTCSAADSRALVPAAAVGAEVAVGGSDGGGSRGIPVGERLLRYEVSVGVGEDGQEVEISRGAWVVDVDCWMTDDLAAMQAVHVMAETSVDAQTGKMRMRRDAEADAVTEREGEEGETEEEEIANSQTSLTRNCLFVHKLNVVGVGTLTMGDLFNVAKLRGFSFDLLNNVGTGFLMVDRFEETCSVMMVGVTQRECVDRLPALLSFLVAPTQAFPLTEQIAVQAADRAGGVREQKAHQTSFPVSKGGGGGAADLLVGGGKGTGVSEDSASACRNEGSTVRKCQAALRLLLRLKPQATHSFPSGLLNPS